MISVRSSAVLTYVGLTCAFAAIGRKRHRLSMMSALVAGLAGASLHLASVLVHHAGHALAARIVGHPMSGIRLWGGLASSVYPVDEPDLPASVHLARAAGGPLASLLLAACVAMFVSRGGELRQLVISDNVFVLGLGSLLPLGFTDGSTLLSLVASRRRFV